MAPGSAGVRSQKSVQISGELSTQLGVSLKPLEQLRLHPACQAWIASLILSLICSLWAYSQVTHLEYAIPDDARSHVVWMFRFLDYGVFPNDIIFDYFQSVAPLGYATLYQWVATIGIHPLTFNQGLPTLLGLITTGYCFGVCWQIFPFPLAGFLSTLLLNQNLWLRDDLISATPRAFFYPLFLAFLYYLLKQSRIGIGVTIALLAGFYPQGVLLAVGVIILQTVWQLISHSPSIKTQIHLLVIGCIISFLVLLPYGIYPSEYGSIITLAEAKTLPDFYPGGRASFFTDNFLDFWITGDRSGLFPQEWFIKGFPPPQLWAGLLFPILLQFPQKFPLTHKITDKFFILPQLLLASASLFFLAHLLLFRLHHPSRYSQHSLRIVFAIAAGMTIALIWDKIHQIINLKRSSILIQITCLCFGFLLLTYPSLTQGFPRTNYVVGKYPLLYEFFNNQPQDIRIASLVQEVNNIPAFSQRSIFVGSEYFLPYHHKYYAELKNRSQDLILAQYSPQLAEVKNFIKEHEINYWILENNALTLDYVKQNHRVSQLHDQAAVTVEKNLKSGIIPVLSHLINSCAVLQVDDLSVLESNCILNTQ